MFIISYDIYFFWVQEYLTKMVGLEWSGSYYPLVIKRGQWTIHHVDMSVPLEPPFIYNVDKTIRKSSPSHQHFYSCYKPSHGWMSHGIVALFYPQRISDGHRWHGIHGPSPRLKQWGQPPRSVECSNILAYDDPIPGWWFQPLWIILVNGKDYPIYYGKNVPNHQPAIHISFLSFLVGKSSHFMIFSHFMAIFIHLNSFWGVLKMEDPQNHGFQFQIV